MEIKCARTSDLSLNYSFEAGFFSDGKRESLCLFVSTFMCVIREMKIGQSKICPHRRPLCMHKSTLSADSLNCANLRQINQASQNQQVGQMDDPRKPAKRDVTA